MRCTSCGEEFVPGVRFCSRCGAAVTSVQASKPANKMLVGVVIAVVLVIPLMGLIAAIALPAMIKRTQIAKETAAIQRILLINYAERDFQSQHGRYATLVELGPPLSHSDTQGYRFNLTASEDSFIIHADPIIYGSTGRRSFYSDQRWVIRQNWGPEPATDESPELK